MKEVLAASLSVVVGLALGASVALASPNPAAHQFNSTREHQSLTSPTAQAGWQGDAAVTPLRGGGGGGGSGYGGGGTCDGTGPKSGSGPKDGSGNNYGK